MPNLSAHLFEEQPVHVSRSGDVTEGTFLIDTDYGIVRAAPGALPAHFVHLLREAGAERWALLRAADPHSLRLSPEDNQARFASLTHYLGKLGYPFITVDARCGERWVKAVLVFDLDRAEALSIGRDFAQRTVLYGNGLDCVSLSCRGLDFCI